MEAERWWPRTSSDGAVSLAQDGVVQRLHATLTSKMPEGEVRWSGWGSTGHEVVLVFVLSVKHHAPIFQE